MPVFDIFKRLVGTTDVRERRGDDRVRATLGARVLVVDDSATIRAVLGKMLVQDGYDVLKAADGENAVEMAQSQYPDLIFLDIVLPGMSGFAVLRALRRDTRTRTTPIIMMSGNQQATEQFYVQRFGADGFIKKPFGRAEVFHSIRSLVQAGRMAARAEASPEDSIPEGMTPEEWDAIPDVALPDDAHAAAAGATGQDRPAQATAAAATGPAGAPETEPPAAAMPEPEPVACAGSQAQPEAAATPPSGAETTAPDDRQPTPESEGTGSGPGPATPARSSYGLSGRVHFITPSGVNAGTAGTWSVAARSMAMRPSLGRPRPGSEDPQPLHAPAAADAPRSEHEADADETADSPVARDEPRG